MSYRILRITNFYTEYIKAYYLKHPEVNKLSYSNQYEHLINDSFEMVSSYSKSLRKIGVDAIDIVTNAELLQKTWALEHQLSCDLSLKDLVFEQIKFYAPDVVWIDDANLMDKNWTKKIKDEIKTIKIIASHICAPYSNHLADFFSSVDIMFTCIPCFQREISKLGVETHLLYHGFDDSILNEVNVNNKYPEIDFVFTGSLYTGYGYHTKRIEFIEEMLKQGINVKIYGNIESKLRINIKIITRFLIILLKKFKMIFFINSISVLKKHKNYSLTKIKNYSKKLRNSVNPPIFGLEMFKVLKKSNICFNLHTDIAQKCAGNVRLFEATGVGACLVTDWKENLAELFELEKEVVTYKTMDECIEKIKWLIKNPNDAKKIALAGQQRTLKDHTIDFRAKLVNKIFLQKLFKQV